MKIITIIILSSLFFINSFAKEYARNELTYCLDKDEKMIVIYPPTYVEGKTSSKVWIRKSCLLDKKTPLNDYYIARYKDGSLKVKYPYKDGYKHGDGRHYSENGDIEFEGKFVNGISVGVHKWHWVDKRHKLKETFYKDGLKSKFVNHFSDGSITYIFYDKYQKIIDAKSYDKDGERDCANYISKRLKYIDYKCLAAKYSLEKELEPIDNNITIKTLRDALELEYIVALNFDDFTQKFYDKNNKKRTKNKDIYMRAVLGVNADQQFFKILKSITQNKDIESIIHKLMMYQKMRKNLQKSCEIIHDKDKRYDEVINLIEVILEYKRVNNLKTIIVFPNKEVVNSSKYSKKLYEEMRYRYVEFLKAFKK